VDYIDSVDFLNLCRIPDIVVCPKPENCRLIENTTDRGNLRYEMDLTQI